MTNRISTVFDFKEQGSGLKKVKADIDATEGSLNKAKAGVKGLWAEFKNNRVAQAAVAGIVAKIGIDAVNAASDLQESVNAVNTTFGESADDIAKLSEKSVENYGVSKRAFNEMSVAFSGFATQVAGEGGNVSEVVDDMATRVADFASVHNIDMADAMTKFQSALAGETEAMRRFGIDVSAAAVETFALKNGLIASKSEMTEAIKVQARYGLLMQETEQWAGDFAATSDGLANSQRSLTAEVENLQAALGEGLTPEVAKAIGLLVELTDAAQSVPGPLTKVAETARLFVDPLHAGREAIKGVKDMLGLTEKPLEQNYESTRKAGSAADKASVEYRKLADKLREGAREATYNADANDEMGRIQAQVTGIVDKAREAQRKFLDSIKHTRDEVGKLKREIDDQQSWIGFLDTWDAINETLTDTKTSSRDAYAALLEQKELVIEYGESIDLPDAVITNMIALIDQGKQAEVFAFMERMQNGVTLPIKPFVLPTSGSSSIRIDSGGNVRSVGRGADGGIVPGPKGQPALIVAEGGETLVPTHKLPGGPIDPGALSGGGGNVTYQITVEAPFGSNPDEFGRRVMEAIRREERWRGPR